MVNPFDLRGPEFLVFYGCLGAAVTVLVFLMRRAGERGDPPHPLSDYLDIAFLRGGAGEAIRVAILTLVDRGMLTLSGDDAVEAGRQDAAGRVTKSTERAIVSRAAVATKTPGADRRRHRDRDGDRGVRADAGATGSAAQPGPEGRSHAAVARRGRRAGGRRGASRSPSRSRAAARTSASSSLLGFAFLIATFVATHPRRTPAGNALVGDLRTLFGGLKDRASSLRPQSGGTDLALLAAVFGVGAALPVYPEAKKLFPQAGASDGGGSSAAARAAARAAVRAEAAAAAAAAAGAADRWAARRAIGSA